MGRRGRDPSAAAGAGARGAAAAERAQGAGGRARLVGRRGAGQGAGRACPSWRGPVAAGAAGGPGGACCSACAPCVLRSATGRARWAGGLGRTWACASTHASIQSRVTTGTWEVTCMSACVRAWGRGPWARAAACEPRAIQRVRQPTPACGPAFAAACHCTECGVPATLAGPRRFAHPVALVQGAAADDDMGQRAVVEARLRVAAHRLHARHQRGDGVGGVAAHEHRGVAEAAVLRSAASRLCKAAARPAGRARHGVAGELSTDLGRPAPLTRQLGVRLFSCRDMAHITRQDGRQRANRIQTGNGV
jgi:hypothetical protein